jgi:hypothetical protein
MSRLRRRGFRLEYAGMAWMTAEAAVAIISGIIASSIALIGFGLDSVIEFFAAAVVIWQLRGTVSEERETRALRLIGGTFFALAAYLTVESITDLTSQHRPEQSLAGIAVTAAALVVMPLLALAKRRTGQQLSNQALIADAAESAFCAFTSAAALLGIGLNAWLITQRRQVPPAAPAGQLPGRSRAARPGRVAPRPAAASQTVSCGPCTRNSAIHEMPMTLPPATVTRRSPGSPLPRVPAPSRACPVKRAGGCGLRRR